MAATPAEVVRQLGETATNRIIKRPPDMSDIELVIQECWSGCEDPDCPYTHAKTGWYCGSAGPFKTREEALVADNAAEDQAIIKCGDDLTNALLSTNEN